jgi:sirohydrochlorin ferrochelatase
MKRGIILVDHGSRRAESNAALEEVANMLRTVVGDSLVVATAHMEIATPTLRDACERCYAHGARELVVVPYFLAEGRHVREDIPRMAEDAVRGLDGVRVVVSGPLGPDEALAHLALRRFEQALDRK